MSDHSEARNPYDEVPYESYPFPQSHPDRMATIATLYGMLPAPVERCRVLELGCSSGGNLIPLAEQFPDSEFVGVDFSRVELASGEKMVQSLGLKNIQLHCRNIRDLSAQGKAPVDGHPMESPADLGKFDYIIAHGVYSWVSDEVQGSLLAACAQRLTPAGVAYVSYNTYPGWHMRGMIRDMMIYRTRGGRNPDDRVRQARGLLDFLAQSVPAKDNAYGMLLSDELEQMRSKEDYYLLHDYLEDINLPIYFHEFIERAEQHGLQYLGEADFQVMATSNFSPQVENMLQTVSGDRIEIEQYMDFLRNRMFRQTLLCHRSVRLDGRLDPERLVGLSVATSARPETPNPDVLSREPLRFRRPNSTMSTSEPLVKAAMLHLGNVWPQAVPFTELLALARSRLDPQPIVIDTSRATVDTRRLAEPILRCYATTHIDLTRTLNSFTTRIGQRPAASGFARLQSVTERRVTNLKHELVSLDDLERHVVPLLDGQKDRAQLIEGLVKQVESGKLVVHDSGRPVSNSQRLREIMGEALDGCLRNLAQKALLHRDSAVGSFKDETPLPDSQPAEPSSDLAMPESTSTLSAEVDWRGL